MALFSDEELESFGQSLTVPEHRQMFDYWRSKAQPGRLPARKDIDPIDIPNLLPWLSVIEADWSQGKPQFRFRLVGTGVVEKFGRDATGLWFEDAYDPQDFKSQDEIYTEVAITRQPAFTNSVPPVPEREFIVCARLIVPLAGGDDRVEQMISLVKFYDQRLNKTTG